MESILEKRFNLIPSEAYKETELVVTLDYERGIGYYIYIIGEWREKCDTCELVSFDLLKGMRAKVLEVKRKSKKANREAIEIAEEQMGYWIDKACSKYGYLLMQ